MKKVFDILSYIEMCAIENCNLQRGMNYRIRPGYSIVLMSTRPGAPYRDRSERGGATIIYEGHDQPRVGLDEDPKHLDQLDRTALGTLTQNGLFHKAAQEFRVGKRDAERVHVYEKVRKGIWTFNGVFRLVDSKVENDGRRNVFLFTLELAGLDTDSNDQPSAPIELAQTRIIPSAVKVQVWQRDLGKCVVCGATDNLHFDHILPFSKGGTSISASNIQLLCARHNLEKRDKL